jgi:hypothetical protein
MVKKKGECEEKKWRMQIMKGRMSRYRNSFMQLGVEEILTVPGIQILSDSHRMGV